MRLPKVILSMAMMLLTVGAFAKTEKVWVQGSVGKLSVVVQTPDGLAEGQKCPVVIMMHGFMGNKDGMLEKMTADKLAAQGIATVKFDFNGHGESEGPFSGMTVPNEIEDAKKVYEYVKSLPFAGDIALTGHSQGGVVASMTAGDYGAEMVKCVVLLAPAAVLRDDAIRGSTMGARYNPLDPPAEIPLFGDKKLGGEYIRTAFNLPIYETAKKYTGLHASSTAQATRWFLSHTEKDITRSGQAVSFTFSLQPTTASQETCRKQLTSWSISLFKHLNN